MRTCKYCGKTSESEEEIFAGICKECLDKMTRVREVKKSLGQAIIEPLGPGDELGKPWSSREPIIEREEGPIDPVDQALTRIRGLLR